MIGSILSNRYRLLRDLGTGGMAKVYLAEDLNENKLVAVKVLHAQFGEDVAYLQRFKREAKLASLLDSPHIVKILDYGSSRDTHFLVMEYVQGKNLREELNKRKALIWQDALHIIDQVCAALENAHQHNIVHRDIKPQNIMLADDGTVKVLDFGIARARLLPSLTQSGFVGSPYYIAPEQAMSEDVDIRSDLYSTGIVLYELITGNVPFDSKSPWSIISKHIVSEFPTIKLDDSDIPPAVETLVRQLTAKRPADRYQTPSEVRAAIADVLAGQPIEVREPLGVSAPAAQSLIDELFQRAEEALQHEDWQQAVNLLTQTLNLKPDHPEASQKLEFAGTQARMEALHQAAMQAMENSQWQDAVDLLTEILEHQPGYKDSDTLMRRAKEALSAPPSAKKTPAATDETPPPEKTAAGDSLLSKLPMRWLAATLAIVTIIVIAVTLVAQNNARPPETPQPTTAELLRRAETAFENGDSATALALLDRIFVLSPDDAGAAALKATVTAEAQYQQQLSGAVEAIAAKNWTDAIEALSLLYENAPSFQPETVSTLLCDSYLNRGNERLSHTAAPNDVATVQAARVDFATGRSLCPQRDDLDTAVSFAQAFISVQKSDATPNAVIDALVPIIKTEPNYARGQAAIALYNAYLSYGDAQQTAGNLQAALDAFTAAINLNLDDVSAAAEKQAQLLSLLAQATPTDAPPTATPTVVQNETPTPQPDTPTYKYPAPVLISPEPEAVFAGQYEEIVLEWQPVDNLADDEFYDVTIRYFVGDEPRYWGSGLIKETSWRVPVEAGYGKAGKDEFWWWVTVRQGGTATDGQPDLPLSPSSEERIFLWRP